MIIGDIDTDREVLIIAEIGNNHEGSYSLAEELIGRAAEAGANAVKFQTFITEHFVSPADEVRFARLKSFELRFDQFEELSKLAHSLGLLFISTPLDLYSAAFLDRVVDAYKIASADNNFFPLIDKVARTGKPVIMSTGISDLSQVLKSTKFLKNIWTENLIVGQLAVLHCVSAYPVPPEQVNLLAIPLLNAALDCSVGYSDHALGIEACVLAVALGACIIEKHFTMDKSFSDFRDHQLSADPQEMKELIRKVRLVTTLLGQGQKIVQSCEEHLVCQIRRSIAAGKNMEKGHILEWSDLTWLRPGEGLRPGDEHLLTGKVLRREVRFGELLLVKDVEEYRHEEELCR